MDGQRPSNHHSAGKEVIPGVAPGSFLPSLFATQSQIPNQSNQSNLQWPKTPFQSWVDQTKGFPMYNMLSNMGTNGTFSSNLDASWQNPSTSQSSVNFASNPLLAAFQQQSLGYMGAKQTPSSSDATPFNPLTSTTSSGTTQPAFNQPPVASGAAQAKQQPKQPDAFLPSTSYSELPLNLNRGSGQATTSSTPTTAPLNYPFKLDDYVNAMHKSLGGAVQQHGAAGSSSAAFQQQQPPIARPVPRAAPTPAAAPPSSTAFDLLKSVAADGGAAKPAASAFDLSQIFQSQARPEPSKLQQQPAAVAEQLQQPSTSSYLPSTPIAPLTIRIPMNEASTSADATFISPRSGQAKRKSGGSMQNGEMAHSPGEDLNLDGFDLFEGLTQKDQDAMLNAASGLDVDFELFNDPIHIPASVAEPPKVPEPDVAVDAATHLHKNEQKKEESTPISAQNKMQMLMERLKKTRAAGGGARAAPTPAPPPPLPPPPVEQKQQQQLQQLLLPPASLPQPVVAAPMLQQPQQQQPLPYHKPKAASEKLEKLTFTPPHSPSDSSRLGVGGISSLISASILPSELARKEPLEKKKKNVPIYLRNQTSIASNAAPVYKKVAEMSKGSIFESKEDEFAFTDEDPEETTERLEREEEEEEEEKRDNSKCLPTPIATAAQPKYIPGIGFDVKEGDRESVTRKEAKKPPPVYPGVVKQARHEALELADRIRKKQRERIGLEFVSVLQSERAECAIDSIQRNAEDADKPPLPRLLIRLPRKNTDGAMEKVRRRRKKKRHYYDDDESEEDDDDWYGGAPKPKKKRGRKPKTELNPEETYSVRLVDPTTIEHSRKEVPLKPMEYLSKKQRLLRSWNQENHDDLPNYNSRGVEGRVEPRTLSKIVSEYKPVEARDRLEKFKPCVGFMPRGTFLVQKAELNKDDCALWRVDNMNLLQKFPGFVEEFGDEERILYKNSSTYSGWCEQLQAGYMVVEVKYIRQTRSETVVEPSVPVATLFPAISDELPERYSFSKLKALINREDSAAQNEARSFILKDDTRNALYMVIRNMLDGALSFDYFAKAEEKPTALEADKAQRELLSEVECHVRECDEVIGERASFLFPFSAMLVKYAAVTVSDSELDEFSCQACGEAPVEKLVQLYDKIADAVVDDDNFYYEEEEERRDELPAVDFLVCGSCSRYATWKHQLLHFRDDLVRRIEERLLEATLEIPSLHPDQILEYLRQNHLWLREVIVSHTETWDAILKADEEEGEKATDNDAESAAADATQPAAAAAAAAESAAESDVAFPAATPLDAAAIAALVQSVAATLAAAPPVTPAAGDSDTEDLIDPVAL